MLIRCRKCMLLVTVLLLVFLSLSAFGERSPWDCPECGRTGNIGNFCGGCAHPAPAQGGKVGISFPNEFLERWVKDGNNLKSQLEAKGYEVELYYADNTVGIQLNQIKTLIDNNCDIIIITQIDSFGQALDTEIGKKDIVVIAYDRLLLDSNAVDYYVTFDNYMVGSLQGKYVKEQLKLDEVAGPFFIEFTAGMVEDANALLFYQGAVDVLKPYIDSGKIIVKSGQIEFQDVATEYWHTDIAQNRANDILNKFYADGTRIDAWVCSNDSTAAGVTNALKENYANVVWPIITGQDCDTQNVKNIISGKQAMSVFKDTRILTDRVVKMIDQIIHGEEVDVNNTVTNYNGKKTVPSYLCEEIVVDITNYKKCLIESGFYSEADLR